MIMEEQGLAMIEVKEGCECGEEELLSCVDLKLKGQGFGADVEAFCLGEAIVDDCGETGDLGGAVERDETIEHVEPDFGHVEQGLDADHEAEQEAIFAEDEKNSSIVEVEEDEEEEDEEFEEDVEKISGLDTVGDEAASEDDDCLTCGEHLDTSSTSKKQGASAKQRKRYPCEECGESFLKPSNLRQHMLCHATEKRYCCPNTGCGCKYKRPDHLKRHMIVHSGQLFFCTWEGCNASFTLVSNLKRHTKLHQVKGDYLQRCGKRLKQEDEKPYICPEPGCGQAFQFASKLQCHEDTTHGIKCKVYQCSDIGCLETFPDSSAMQHHIRIFHGFFVCEVCGLSVSKRCEAKHRKTHGGERFPCPFPDCQHSYTNKSNLNNHVKAVHNEMRPFMCSFPECGKTFAYKAVRDRHEKTGAHCPTTGDFEIEDELFLSRPRGGRKPAAIKSPRHHLLTDGK